MRLLKAFFLLQMTLVPLGNQFRPMPMQPMAPRQIAPQVFVFPGPNGSGTVIRPGRPVQQYQVAPVSPYPTIHPMFEDEPQD